MSIVRGCGIGCIATMLVAALICGCQSSAPLARSAEQTADKFQPPRVFFSTAPLYSQREYQALFTSEPVKVDGVASDAAWSAAPWSEDFTDIEGPARATPRQRTRVKMAWNQTHFLVLAELYETDLWATLKKHDEIIFQDNDFEIFVDPDGDTREYYEIEVNALATIFDLYLPEPYRTQGSSQLPKPGADHSWDAKGIQVGIALDGTLNDSRDQDKSWTVEMAIPWSVFEPVRQPDGRPGFQRASRPPVTGDVWRINFSRVQWTLEKVGNSYTKVPGKPEDNWVWSPQWIIDMHVPQWWGRVEFCRPATEGALSK